MKANNKYNLSAETVTMAFLLIINMLVFRNTYLFERDYEIAALYDYYGTPISSTVYIPIILAIVVNIIWCIYVMVYIKSEKWTRNIKNVYIAYSIVNIVMLSTSVLYVENKTEIVKTSGSGLLLSIVLNACGCDNSVAEFPYKAIFDYYVFIYITKEVFVLT